MCCAPDTKAFQLFRLQRHTKQAASVEAVWHAVTCDCLMASILKERWSMAEANFNIAFAMYVYVLE